MKKIGIWCSLAALCLFALIGIPRLVIAQSCCMQTNLVECCGCSGAACSTCGRQVIDCSQNDSIVSVSGPILSTNSNGCVTAVSETGLCASGLGTGSETSCSCGPICGNGVIESGEQCDGSNLGGLTCQSFGFQKGTLACDSSSCQFDTSSCIGSGSNGKYPTQTYYSDSTCDPILYPQTFCPNGESCSYGLPPQWCSDSFGVNWCVPNGWSCCGPVSILSYGVDLCPPNLKCAILVSSYDFTYTCVSKSFAGVFVTPVINIP
jgi:hypothetical protein